MAARASISLNRACIAELHHDPAHESADRFTLLNRLAFDRGPRARVYVDVNGPVLVAALLPIERAGGAETFGLDAAMQRSVVALDAPLEHARLVERITVLEHGVFELGGVRDAAPQLLGAFGQVFGIVPVDRLVVA